MQVLSVTSEIFPLIKTGGLADVTGALPKALTRFGISTRTLVPAYRPLRALIRDCPPLIEFEDLLGETASLYAVEIEGLELFLLDAPALFDRPGGPYIADNGHDHPDNWRRFAVLCLAAAEIAAGSLPGWQPDLVHTHDWQTALTSVYMREMDCKVPVVLTIHNLAFQGQFSSSLLSSIGLPPSVFSTECLEYYGDICYLKGGLMTADIITAVSPTYAREILTARFGMGLEGVLAARRSKLWGIVNGIDTEIWDPLQDPHLFARFDQKTISLKRLNKMELQNSFGLNNDDGPLFAAVTRLTWQKGMDMLAEAADEIIHGGGKLIILGQGDHEIEEQLKAVADRYPGRMAVQIGYDEETAHRLHGGADSVIQPSRFEPCGLTQLYALRYGCVPVVARTGGLAETIIDANDAALSAKAATGFQFHPVTTEGLRHALRRALHAYASPKEWRRLQIQAMRANYSWERSAEQYANLYGNLVKQPVVRKNPPARRLLS
ncbi:glycogen synthase GlgA [Rhizobium paknamense]|uniref:Glycogen synthase n=1 Tax=Rhizobium paknamense TaxID=1206817 RepID=A0ABU0IBH1_9HYPH|nr:glycogen synthase GlgA [Rhizobium paknamense]MDQ0455578.1 starch synthase [Rhizobium paknamense]